MSTLHNDFTALVARFEEGVSADPTKNMSPEDAAKWKAMNEEHGDKFKKAMQDLAALDLELTAASLPGVGLDKDAAALEEMSKLADLDRAADQMIGRTILEQMGGARRLQVMLGVQQIILLNDGVGIKWPSKQPSKGNYVEIKLNGSDLYDVTFFNVGRGAKRPVKKFDDVYAEDLVDIFEKQTGWYLRLASEQAHLLVRAAGTRGPDPRGRDWKKLENPTRWNWFNREQNINFAVNEQAGPGIPIYTLRVLTDHGMFKHVKPFQWKTPEEAFKAAAMEFPKLAGEMALNDLTEHWSKVGSAMKMWDGHFFTPDQAKSLGDRRFNYVAFKDLSPSDQSRARRAYPHKSVGAMYDFIDEHYLYPVDKSGNLARANARRVLAIPLKQIQDADYMKSLGYTMNPGWPKAASDGDEKESKFEEGVSADPTKNMSPEDAAEWKKQNEANKDKFKAACDLMAEGCPDNLDESECKEWEANTEKYKDVVKDQAKTAGHATYDEYVRDWKKLKYPETVKGKLLPKDEWEKLMNKGGDKTAYEEGSRVPDGWDNGQVEGKKKTDKPGEEGSDTPDGSGNQTKRAGKKPTPAEKAEAKKLFDKWRAEAEGGEMDDLDESWQNFLDGDLTLKEIKANPPTKEAASKVAEVIEEMYALVSEDGYMLGATDDWSDARSKSFWRYSVDDDHLAEGKLMTLVNVPLPMAEKFKDMGTHAQTFNDGYDAWAAARRFAKGSGVRLAVEKEAATGLYGHTKRVQADCEGCIGRVRKAATQIARNVYARNEQVAEFLATHARRADSLPAQLLVAALREAGPKVARQVRLAELRLDHLANKTPAHKAVWAALGTQSKVALNQVQSKEAFADLLSATQDMVTMGLVAFDGVTVAKVTDADAQTGEDIKQTTDKNAARNYGLYGFGEKVAKLGLQACSDLRHEAGKIAHDLHRRRADRHAAITDFFANHSKQAKCAYSRLLAASYPELKVASARNAPRTVQAWLEWAE